MIPHVASVLDEDFAFAHWVSLSESLWRRDHMTN